LASEYGLFHDREQLTLYIVLPHQEIKLKEGVVKCIQHPPSGQEKTAFTTNTISLKDKPKEDEGAIPQKRCKTLYRRPIEDLIFKEEDQEGCNGNVQRRAIYTDGPHPGRCSHTQGFEEQGTLQAHNEFCGTRTTLNTT
jgi:hypothetical protein